MEEFNLSQLLNEDSNKYKISISENDNFINTDYKMISYNDIPGIVNITKDDFNNNLSLTYHLDDLVLLKKYINDESNAIKWKELIDVLEQITNVIINSESYLLDEKRFLLNLDHIYIQPKSSKVKLLYIPLGSFETSNGKLKKLVSDVMQNVIFTEIHKDNRIGYIINYLNRNEYLDFVNLNKYLKEIKYLSSKNKPKIEKENLDLIDIEKNNNNKKIKIKNNNKKEASTSQKIVVNNKNKIKSRRKKENKPKVEEISNKKSGILGKLFTSNNGTLVDMNNNQKITIDKKEIKIGRQEEKCDHVIHNKKVSRVHFYIRKKKNDYYVVDNGSSNGTFLNGEKLTPQKEYSLSEDDVIKVSDESFQFRIS